MELGENAAKRLLCDRARDFVLDYEALVPTPVKLSQLSQRFAKAARGLGTDLTLLLKEDGRFEVILFVNMKGAAGYQVRLRADAKSKFIPETPVEPKSTAMSTEHLMDFILNAIKRLGGDAPLSELKRKYMGFGGDLQKYELILKQLIDAESVSMWQDGETTMVKLLVVPD